MTEGVFKDTHTSHPHSSDEADLLSFLIYSWFISELQMFFCQFCVRLIYMYIV